MSKNIDLIIESIIDKNKNEFNRKSQEKQIDDKDKISKEINKLLKGREKDDREIILSILLDKVNDPSESFLDSNGNIDIDKIKIVTNQSIKIAEKSGLVVSENQVNRFNKQNKESIITSIILTPIVINKLINNYEKISIEEKEALWNEYSNLSREDQRRLENASTKVWYSLAKDASGDEKKYFENMGKVGEKLTELYDKAEKGDKEAQRKLAEIFDADKEFNKSNKENTTGYSDDRRKKFAKYISLLHAREQEIRKIKEESKKEISEEQKSKIFKIINQDKEVVEEYNKKNFETNFEYSDELVDFYLIYCKERGEALVNVVGIENEKNESISPNNAEEFLKESFMDAESKNSNSPIFEDMNFISTSEQIDLSNEFPKQENKEKDISKDLSNALKIYKEYFQDFDEETIEAISEMTTEEITANLKDDFDSMLEENQIDDKTKDVLYVLADNLTTNTKNILLDSEKRDAFFEKMQSSITNDEIKDSEISELFEKISVELQVGEIEQTVEYNEFFQEIDNVNSAPIEEVEAHKEFIEEHENFEIDPAWEEICRDAQAKGIELKGKALIELFEKYKEDIELLDSEKRVNAPSDRGEKAGNEEESRPDVSVSEKVEIQVEQDNLQGTSLEEQESIELSDEILEESQSGNKIEHFGKKGKNERIAVIEKDEQGNANSVQVFKPIEFLRASNITFGQIEEQQQILTEIVKSQTQNKTVQIKQGENPVKEEDEDTRE